jgi:hypothetical protein
MIGTDDQPRSPAMTVAPSMSGRPRSSTTTSGRACAATRSASRPSGAMTTS